MSEELDIEIYDVKDVKNEESTDMVHNPKHYRGEDGKDCWTKMGEQFGTDAVIIFDCLNAFKYHWRAGKKDGNSKEQDIAKMQNYIKHAKEIVDNILEEEDITPLEPEDKYAIRVFRDMHHIIGNKE